MSGVPSWRRRGSGEDGGGVGEGGVVGGGVVEGEGGFGRNRD